MNKGALSTAPEEDPSKRAFTITSIQTGACQFIPLPFLDDLLVKRLRRRLVASQLAARGLRYERGVPACLVDWENRSFPGRVRAFLTGLIVKPLRKLLRTILIWQTARRAGRTMVETHLLARFLAHPQLSGAVPSGKLTRAKATELAAIFGGVVHKIDYQLVGHAGRRIWRSVRKKTRRARVTHEEDMGEINLVASIEREQPGFLAEFDRRLEEALAPHQENFRP